MTFRGFHETLAQTFTAAETEGAVKSLGEYSGHEKVHGIWSALTSFLMRRRSRRGLGPISDLGWFALCSGVWWWVVDIRSCL